MRKIRPISIIQPLQISTAELLPNSYIQGTIGAPVNVVGSTLAAKIVLSRNPNMKLSDGIYRVTMVNATDFKVTDLNSAVDVAGLKLGATGQGNVISGINVNIADFATVTAGDYADFETIGDQTYIIPGTIVGRVAEGQNMGKWVPVRATDNLNDYDTFRVVQTVKETDRTKTVLEYGYEASVSNVHITDVVVFGEIIEKSCKLINLTDAIKAKMGGIAWI